ncbi:MAG: acyl-CoA transferase [Chloroflexi bacterium]|nr:acyl-CoA transferase [Chloroflexota bacterium]
MRALDGIKVLDLTTIVSGPFAAAILADFGADVIKIEPPGGENARKFSSPDLSLMMGSLTPHIMNLQRNKRAMVLDLRNEQGLKIFSELVLWADIVLDNYRPGVTTRLKIDYASLKKINPKVIACSITGFGLTGPEKDRAALDATVQAYAGVMGMTGDPNGSPVRAGPLYGDLSAGMGGALAILAAVIGREKTGEGQHIDISMLDIQMALINYHATMQIMSGIPAPRTGNEMQLHVPYNSYQATDGWIFVAVTIDTHWEGLIKKLKSMELPSAAQLCVHELEDGSLSEREARIASRDLINSNMSKIIAFCSKGHWVKELTEAGIPVAPVNTLGEAVEDSQVLSRNMIVSIEHPEGGSYKATGNPFKMSNSENEIFNPPPTLGQHTEQILAEVLNYSPEQIKLFYENEVVG